MRTVCRFRGLAVLLALSTGLLTGCGPSQTAALPSPAPSPAAAATPTSAPTTATATPGPLESPSPNRTVKLSGVGSATVPLSKPSSRTSGFLVLVQGNDAAAPFQIKVLGALDQLLISTASPVYALHALDLQNGTSSAFEVHAVGAWSLEVIDPLALPQFGQSYGGKNNATLVYTGPGGVADVVGNPFDKPFSVTSFGTFDTARMVSTSRQYDGSSTLAPGVRIVKVVAKGAWTIAVRPPT